MLSTPLAATLTALISLSGVLGHPAPFSWYQAEDSPIHSLFVKRAPSPSDPSELRFLRDIRAAGPGRICPWTSANIQTLLQTIPPDGRPLLPVLSQKHGPINSPASKCRTFSPHHLTTGIHNMREENKPATSISARLRTSARLQRIS